METDAELVERCRAAGDRKALDTLFRRHVDRVYRIARRVIRNDAEAEDVTQATFVAALRDLRTLQSADRFAPWICGIAVRLSRRALRSADRESRRRDVVRDRSASPSKEPSMNDLEAVFNAVDQLPEEYRLPILLHHCDGLSYEEIADALAMPRGTVGTNIHRGLDRLRSAVSGALSVGAMTALLATAGSSPASAATVEAVARIASTGPMPRSGWPLKAKASIGIAVGGGLLLMSSLALRFPAPEKPRAPVVATRPKGANAAVPPARDASPSQATDSAPVVPPPEPAPPPFADRISDNERNAIVNLHVLATAEADFRANDRDANRVHDFWTLDVSGLYRLEGGENPRSAIKLIQYELAAADAAPHFSADLIAALPRKPCKGYWYKVLPVPSTLQGRSPSEFTFTAYPAEYGLTGLRTFVISESNMVFCKDLMGNPAGAFPSDAELQLWDKEAPAPAPPSQIVPDPEALARLRIQAGRRGFATDDLKDRRIHDFTARTEGTLDKILALDQSRWMALHGAHERLLEQAKRLEKSRALVRTEGDLTVIEIPAFPQEGSALLAEWMRELESILTPAQKIRFDRDYGYSVFPLGLGQHAFQVTLRRVGERVVAEERVTLPSGETVLALSLVDGQGFPRSCRHLLR